MRRLAPHSNKIQCGAKNASGFKKKSSAGNFLARRDGSDAAEPNTRLSAVRRGLPAPGPDWRRLELANLGRPSCRRRPPSMRASTVRPGERSRPPGLE